MTTAAEPPRSRLVACCRAIGVESSISQVLSLHETVGTTKSTFLGHATDWSTLSSAGGDPFETTARATRFLEMATMTRFEIKAVAPFRLDLTVWALRRRPGNAVDRWDGHTYRRAMRVGDTLADVAVVQIGTPEAPRLAVALTTDTPVARGRTRVETTTMLQRLLGLEIDLADFYRCAEPDPDLYPLARGFRGLKPPRFLSVFEGLVNAVACQQLTLTFGIELLNRLAATYGRLAPGERVDAHAFPEARDLVGIDPDALRTLGFSRQKSVAIVELADRIDRGEFSVEDITYLDDDAATTALRTLRGVGRWSAEYVLLRGLGRLEVFPGDDVGASNNLQRRLGLSAPLDYDEVLRVTSRWAPYSGLVYFHFLLAGIDEAGWLDARSKPGE
jgi:DNA-3-methyladenine glycosylase II